MATEPQQRIDQVVAFLGDRYGLTVERLEPAARGWTGETYVATVLGGERVFVKIYLKGRNPPTAAPAISVLAEFHRLGLSWVSQPISAMSGALHEWLGDDLFVVFTYINAPPTPFAFGGERRGDLIARVHQQTEHLASPVARDAFAPSYGNTLWRTLERGRRDPATDEPRQGLQQYLDEHGTAVADAWTTFGEIARACRAASFELVLSHGDWPFNLLQRPDGTLYLIDWDELLLAPAERDTWFAHDDPGFWRGYRAQRAGHTVDALATAYYVHSRYFEDLLGFAQVILGDDAFEERSKVLALLRSDWMKGLRARMEQFHLGSSTD